MVSITTAKADLEAALKVVANTVGAGADISSHYLFRATADRVELLSSGGRTFSSSPLVATHQGVGMFTVEAKRIHVLLDAVPAGSVLEFGFDGTEVAFSTEKGDSVFSSLDPANFPFWDSVLAAAKPTAKVAAERLHAAYAHARQYVYDQEAKAAHLCVAEFRDGNLFATDQQAVSAVHVEGMAASKLRVFGKDIGALMHFLALDKTQEVEVLEAAQASFVRRADGSVFGETLYASRFPDIKVDWRQEDDHYATVNREDVSRSIRFLQASAGWDDRNLRVTFGTDKVTFSMKAVGGKAITQSVAATRTDKEGAIELPENGFVVNHAYLTQVLSDHSSSEVRIGVSRKNPGGWMRVKDERAGDIYQTTVAWTKVTG